jgi:hypothetical protein
MHKNIMKFVVCFSIIQILISYSIICHSIKIFGKRISIPRAFSVSLLPFCFLSIEPSLAVSGGGKDFGNQTLAKICH